MDTNSNQVQGIDFSQTPIAQGVVPGGAPTAPTVPVIKQDEQVAGEDELDQEWVNRAKDIVERTKADPFAQSNELNKIKAEYLMTRFSKELNVGNKPSQ